MAEYHYNVLSLWSLSPFPSMVRIPEYPLTALEDVMRSVIIPQPEMSGWKMYTEDMKKGLYPVKKMSMDEKMEFWRQVMSCAAVFMRWKRGAGFSRLWSVQADSRSVRRRSI